MVNKCKLDEVRKVIAAARGAGVAIHNSQDGSTAAITIKDREAANVKRCSLYRTLDACRTELNLLVREDAGSDEQDTAEAKV